MEQLKFFAGLAHQIQVDARNAVAFGVVFEAGVAFAAGTEHHGIAKELVARLLAHPVGGRDENRILTGAGHAVGAPFVLMRHFPVGADRHHIGAVERQTARRFREGHIPPHQHAQIAPFRLENREAEAIAEGQALFALEVNLAIAADQLAIRPDDDGGVVEHTLDFGLGNHAKDQVGVVLGSILG